jgi:hypothetical protein
VSHLLTSASASQQIHDLAVTLPGEDSHRPPSRRPSTPRYAHTVQRILITIGLAIVLAGLLWPWLSRLPLGRLPGDLLIQRPGVRLYAPFTTMIIVSLVLSLLLWLFRR